MALSVLAEREFTTPLRTKELQQSSRDSKVPKTLSNWNFIRHKLSYKPNHIKNNCNHIKNKPFM